MNLDTLKIRLLKMKRLLILFIFIGNSVFAQDTTRLSLLFLGDIMQHDSQISDAYEPATKRYDYNPCFQFVKPYIQAPDLAIGNLELTLAGPPYRGYPQFSAPDELLVALKDMGMDVLVTANNHCVDTGQKGLERTIQMLDSLRIPHTGTFADEVSRLNDHPLLVQKNNFKLAILNYTFSTNGLPVTKPNIVNRIDTVMMEGDLKKAKSLKPDAIIVFLHWGIEYQSLPAKSQKDVTEFCFDHGAQLVIGAHPHVIQPMEWRKEKNQLVTYSLGNFVSGQRKRYTDGGSMITMELEKISFAGDSSIATIDTAAYVLEWVYKSTGPGKNYYVLPVPTFENDTTGFIKDTSSKEAFKTFVSDSRSLLKKYNYDLTESLTIPPDKLVRYKVLAFTAEKDASPSWSVMPPLPYGVEVEKDNNGKVSVFSGYFSDRNVAEKYRQRLAEQFNFKDAVVVEFTNGVQNE
jgi:poly-gamma-glutamate capsule biosynthesis protein CapA/YwtB (metallophosphatase superfamily)